MIAWDSLGQICFFELITAQGKVYAEKSESLLHKKPFILENLHNNTLKKRFIFGDVDDIF